jgi:hypothetical protein
MHGKLAAVAAQTLQNQAAGPGGGIDNVSSNEVPEADLGSTVVQGNDGSQVTAANTPIVGNGAAAGGGIDDHGAAAVTLMTSPVLKNKPDICVPVSSIAGCTG